MNNTPIEKITLKCVVTGELVTYRGWDYISKRIQKAGSLDALQKTFTSRKGAKLSNGNSAILMAKTMDTLGAVKKPRKTKQESVDSFVMPGSKKAKGSFEARLVDGKYILSKNGEEYTQFSENSNKNKSVVDSQ
jgi:hypothetical protein